MTDENLDLLVGAAVAGGGWAFAQLWEQLSPSVLGYLRGRSVPDPEDVTSEVFLAAFQRVGGFRGDGAQFRAWLFTLAHHKGVDAVRRGPARRELLADEVPDGRRAASAEDDAMVGFGTQEVRRLLATLTVDQREVVLLRIVGELSLDETATVLGKPVGSVKQLQRRGLARLRREIEREPVTCAATTAMTQARWAPTTTT
jgi:RNA polymerase sigma-70 factor (ECF subfamily)